jgi:hypothetical protein
MVQRNLGVGRLMVDMHRSVVLFGVVVASTERNDENYVAIYP